MSILTKFFGTKHEREITKLRPDIDKINSLESKYEALSSDELKAMTPEFKQRLDNGAPLDSIMHEAFALVREAGKRTLGMRHYDVQLVGGMVLHSGKIAEMRTGEGKTLTATLPVYLNALEGRGVHLITVNDYLARRDAEWMGRLYNWLGQSVGVIVHGVEDYDRQEQYRCDITYGQNSEFGFDYLRDNMKMSPDRKVQRELRYTIVDEVDSILVDEARTPLIISGPAEQSADLYHQVDKIMPRLKQDVDYTVDEKAHSAMLTDQGVERVQKLLSLGNLYDPSNISFIHHIYQALRAHTLYKRDVNYLIDDGKIVIIDEFTGRKMPGRRWSDGLHQAIEAKEDVTIEEENVTLATVTYQNFFRMYDKLSGMTGTADTEAAEFNQIYKLDVQVIPTNKPMVRDDRPDLVYKNEKGKLIAVADDIREAHTRGQPVLVGTVSVEKSEVVSHLLKQHKIPHETLNAKNHSREALIVAQAGRKGSVTISTNMAGRGTDIVLGGNPDAMAKARLQEEGIDPSGGPPYRDNPDTQRRYQELFDEYKATFDAEKQQVLDAGGLHIVGTERHESRRIDNQLRGRAGRQGDAGSSRFYLSLQDDLMRIFGGDKITGLMERLGMEEDTPIEHKWVTRAIENAQKKVEGNNFDVRKNLLEYDDVMNQQRKTLYALRNQILTGRYEPTLSEDEIKAGKAPEIPEKSGDWTVPSLTQEVKPTIEGFITRVMEPPQVDDNEAAPAWEKPTWRQVQHEIWRQTNALVDIEGLYDGPRDELINHVTGHVAASMIQQRERLFDLADTLIGEIVATHCPPGTHTDEWDFDELETALRDMFHTEITVDRKAPDTQTLAEQLWGQVSQRLDERHEELSRSWLLYLQRHFFLEEIDRAWIDHLKVMEHLREGIGLRGYGQKDPKKEYKKEGFDLFGEMMRNIQTNVGRKLFRVQLREEQEEIPDAVQRRRNMKTNHAESGVYGKAADGGQESQEKQKTVRRDKPKVGRNDPCPCGSGKKYKKCHGRTEGSATA